MNNKDHLIKILLNYIYTEIETIRNKYNNHEVNFKVNDIVYYFDEKK